MDTQSSQVSRDRERARRRRRVQVRRRRFVLLLCVVALIVLIVVLSLTLGGSGGTGGPGSVSGSYSATLSGQNEVPPVTTSATGSLTLTADSSGTALNYVLTVSKLSEATLAQIHQGKAGATGAAVATLYPGPTKTGILNGVLAEGSLTSANLIGTLEGKTLADLVALIKAGNAYVNVSTVKQPKGNIRGQLK